MPTPSNIDYIREWLDQLPEEQIEQEIVELEAQISALSAEINTRREALGLKRRFNDLYRPQIEREVVDTGAQGYVHVSDHIVVTKHAARPASIRESVLRVMAETSAKDEWPVGDLYNALAERGWLEPSTQALRSLGAALSRMTAEGEIERARRGVYKRAVPETASQSLLDLGGDPG